MTCFRYVFSVTLGIIMAFLLFLLAHSLVSGEKKYDTEASPISLVDFIRVDQDEYTRFKDRTPPKKPAPPDQPPPPPRLQMSQQSDAPRVAVNIETPKIAVSPGGGDGPYLGRWSARDPKSEGDVLPIVRINPQYPRQALLDGIEGWVRVEFMILEDGTVDDVRVVDADPPRIFNRSAVRAVLKWKFKPRIVDGEPTRRLGTQVIEFELVED